VAAFFELEKETFEERSFFTTCVATKAQKCIQKTLLNYLFRAVLRDFTRFGAYFGRF
jgi:hypothetical protein